MWKYMSYMYQASGGYSIAAINVVHFIYELSHMHVSIKKVPFESLE